MTMTSFDTYWYKMKRGLRLSLHMCTIWQSMSELNESFWRLCFGPFSTSYHNVCLPCTLFMQSSWVTKVHSGTRIQFEARFWCRKNSQSLRCVCASMNKLQYEHIKKNLASKCHRSRLAGRVTPIASWILTSFLCAFINIHDVFLGGAFTCIDLQPRPQLTNINETSQLRTES